ncbi:hypothetical protein Tco_0481587 [Tanacetum coccineum]
MPVEIGSFDVIIGMDCSGKGSSNEHESRLKLHLMHPKLKVFAEGIQVFLAHVTEKKEKDKSEDNRLEDVPIVQDFPEVFPKDFSVPHLGELTVVGFVKEEGMDHSDCGIDYQELNKQTVKNQSNSNNKQRATEAHLKEIIEAVSALKKERMYWPKFSNSTVLLKTAPLFTDEVENDPTLDKVTKVYMMEEWSETWNNNSQHLSDCDKDLLSRVLESLSEGIGTAWIMSYSLPSQTE